MNPARPGADRWTLALAGVAGVWVLVQFAVTFHVGLGWDETVYLSQYARDVPAGVFSAPRARGMPLLVAPLTAVTTATPAIRAYLTVLSGTGLFCAFWPWLRVRPGAVAPGAAALFASVWVALFYGNEAMPDMFVAYGAVAAVGLFLLAVRTPRRRWAPVGLAGAVAFTALVRPSDSLWVAATLVVAALVVRAWRRPAVILAVVTGIAIGWGEWIGEAFAYYGGPLARLSAAGAENETGLHFSLMQHLAALSETQILCRPACHQVSPLASLWFLAVPVVAVAGCVVTRRTRRFAPAMLATAVAAVFLASYLVGVGYAAPRFLLPYYALAALPATEAVGWLVRGAPKRIRLATASLAVVGILANLAVQVRGLDDVLHRQIPPRTAVADVGTGLVRLGIRPPCLVYGHDAAQIAFYAHCHEWSVKTKWGGAHLPARIGVARARGEQIVVMDRHAGRPARWLDRWRSVSVVDTSGRRWHAYLPATHRPR